MIFKVTYVWSSYGKPCLLWKSMKLKRPYKQNIKQNKKDSTNLEWRFFVVKQSWRQFYSLKASSVERQ